MKNLVKQSVLEKMAFLGLTNSNMYCLTVGDYLFSKFNKIDNFHDFYTE